MADYRDLDDLLSELEAEGESTPKKAWSFSEIDALLGEEDVMDEIDKAAKEPDLEPDPEPLPEPEHEEEPEEEPEEPEEDEFEEDEFEEEPEPEPVPEKKKIVKVVGVVGNVSPKLPKGEEKTVVFDAETVKTKSVDRTVAERVDDELDNIKSKRPDQTQVIMALADDEDMEMTEVPTKEKALEPETEEQRLERRALAQKTIGIQPIYNENIKHQIVTEKIEKSPTGAMETDRYRERFLNVPKQHLERTADYAALHQGEKPQIERAGRIVKRSKFRNTADLEPVPTIVSASEERSNFDKTIVATSGTKVIEHKDNDSVTGQIKLTGFGEEEVIDQIDEENAEEALREVRGQKVAEFQLDADFDEVEEYYEEPEASGDPGAASVLTANFINDEYRTEGDKDRIAAALAKAVRFTGISAIAQAVLTLVALIISGIVIRSGGNLSIVGGGALGCGLINIVILAVACAFGLPVLIRGLNGIANQKPNASTGTLIAVVACLIEDLGLILFSSEGYADVAIYTGAACGALAIANVARLITLLRAKNNFAFVTNGTQLYSTEQISGEDDAFEIGRGLLIGDPAICYNARMERPSYFIENSFEDDPADDYADKLIYITVILAVLFAFIFGIIHRSVLFALGTFAAFCSVGIPAFLLLASNIGLFWKNRQFNSSGAAIVGHRAVEDSTDANAYVLDATDIFKSGSSSIIGIKTFHGMRIDDAILYAAALVIESDGPLSYIFDSVILGKKDLLPPVESLAYEERLGLSAWVHTNRVLFGTRELLINHNVEAPDRQFENQYVHDGRNVAYLAIAGKIAAMFVIKYQPDAHVGKYLRYLDRAGVSILIRSCDCNITEEMICRHFKLPASAVKILSPVSGDIFQQYRNEDIETAPAGLIHNGTLESSITAFYEARELSDGTYVNKTVATIYTGMALHFGFLLCLIGGPESMGINCGQIIAFQALWTVIASAIPIIKRRIDR